MGALKAPAFNIRSDSDRKVQHAQYNVDADGHVARLRDTGCLGFGNARPVGLALPGSEYLEGSPLRFLATVSLGCKVQWQQYWLKLQEILERSGQ